MMSKGDFELEMERAKSREIVLDAIPQLANFVFLAEGKNLVSPDKGDIFTTSENVHFPSRNSWCAHTTNLRQNGHPHTT